MIKNDHDGPRVVPGRYAGEAIRLHDGPTPQQLAHEEEKDEAALLISAIDTAKDQFGPPPAKPDPCADAPDEAVPGVGACSNADALADVARVFLNAAPEDRSGEDRTFVVVHVSAENLAGNVPAGTVQPVEAECQIEGSGRLRPLPRNSTPATAPSAAPWSTSTATCSLSAAPDGW